MKLTNRQKSIIWKSLNLNEEFFDDNPDMNTEDIIEEKQLKDCNFSLGVYPSNTNITNITKLLVDLNNHTSINQNKENIFNGLVLWNYDPKFISFKFGFDSIKEDKLEDTIDTFKYIIEYLLGQFGTFDVVLGKPNKHTIITTKKISLNDKDISPVNSLMRCIMFDIVLKKLKIKSIIEPPNEFYNGFYLFLYLQFIIYKQSLKHLLQYHSCSSPNRL